MEHNGFLHVTITLAGIKGKEKKYKVEFLPIVILCDMRDAELRIRMAAFFIRTAISSTPVHHTTIGTKERTIETWSRS